MTTKLVRAWLLLSAAVWACIAPSASGRPPTFELGRGDSRVWSGPHIDRATGSSCGPQNCWTYRLQLMDPGRRLRVGIDHPDHHDEFALEVEGPDGTATTARHGFLETPEVLVPAPRSGLWTVRVIAEDASKTGFEVRAKLEMVAPGPSPGQVARPNLRPEPGFDFSFTAPAGSNYAGGGEVPIDVSCHADEVAEDLALRCLRFSFGYQNTGPGPLALRFDPLTDLATGTTKVRQRIYVGDRTPDVYSDNDYEERPAGTATYHKVHGHFHYDAVFQAQVLRVLDLERGRAQEIGIAEKRGACAHDWVLVDFERFYQDVAGTADSGTDCSFGFTDPRSTVMRIGLSRGWADIYTANLSDNYAHFGLGDEGLFLIRVWADPDDHIAESNENDNVAYSLIEVTGDEVRQMERGRGAGPWDPASKRLRGLGE